MALVSWQALDEALARRRGVPTFWWRDDDASEPSDALKRLLHLSQASAVPLALAVVPLNAVPALFERLAARVLMHGTDHHNRAAPDEKKTEFAAAEPAAQALRRLDAARVRLAALAGPAFLPVLAPPWNRLPRSLVPRLPEVGLQGLSGFGRRGDEVPGVREINTHVDIIDWHGTRGFVGEEAALAAVLKHVTYESEEPIGVLTHHAVHDAGAWAFLAQLFERTRRAGARWADAQTLFPTAG
jgi:peptidoglycan/xylan/chitin deacetylase (PgdA/CDA1 family)